MLSLKPTLKMGTLSALLLSSVSMASLPEVQEQPQPRTTASVSEELSIVTPTEEQPQPETAPRISEASSDLIDAIMVEGKSIEQSIRHAAKPVIRDDIKPALKDAKKGLNKLGKKLKKSKKNKK